MINNAVFNQHYYCKQLGKTLHTEFVVFACVLAWECISKKHVQKSEDNCVETVLSFHIMWVLRVKLELPGLSSMFLYLLRYLTISKDRTHTGPSSDSVLNLQQKLLLSVRHYQEPEGSLYSTKCLLKVYVPPMQQGSVSESIITWTVNRSATYTFNERLDKGLLSRPLPWDLSWKYSISYHCPLWLREELIWLWKHKKNGCHVLVSHTFIL